MATGKTFYLETFGCQMNAHDSEKVIGTLLNQGYQQVETEEEAGLILYNTCSIQGQGRAKGLQSPERLQKAAQGRQAVRGAGVRGAAGGRKDLRACALRVAGVGVGLVSQAARDAQRLEAGENRITGLDDRQTEETFETEFTARQNPYRGYITIIEGCDKFCSYCVVPYTRGKERSRRSSSVLEEARRIADLGFTEIQLLGQNVNSYRDPEGKSSFSELLAAVGQVPGIRRVRFTTSHPRDFTRDIVEAIDAYPTLCDHVHLPVQSGSARVLKAMAREYTPDWYLERISWIKAAKRPISLSTDIIVGFPGRDRGRFH